LQENDSILLLLLESIKRLSFRQGTVPAHALEVK